jgi:hypothetical protein
VRFDARLRRLEAKSERLPVVFHVRWGDETDDGERDDRRRIRLRWRDDREPHGEMSETSTAP